MILQISCPAPGPKVSKILLGLPFLPVWGLLDRGTMKNVLLAPVSPPVDLARGRETQIGPILAHFGHFGTFGLSGALLLDPENQRNGESERVIYPHVDRI